MKMIETEIILRCTCKSGEENLAIEVERVGVFENTIGKVQVEIRCGRCQAAILWVINTAKPDDVFSKKGAEPDDQAKVGAPA